MASGARRQLFSTGAMNDGQDLHSTASRASKTKCSVTVKPKSLLSAVLAEAGLPEVKYKTYARRNGRFGATIYFFPSQTRTSADATHMILHGEPAVDANEAMQNAAAVCLERLQGTMDIKFDCPQVHKLKADKRYLSSSVAQRDREIEDLKTKVDKKNMQIGRLSKSWGSLAESVLDSAGRIDKTAV